MQQNILEIEKVLPASSSSGDYSRTEEILLQTYYILVHAEIEEFIEQCISKKINEISRDYKLHGVPHKILLSLVFAFLKEDDAIKSIRKSGSIDNYIDYMNGRYRYLIRENHGIREENLAKLFAPLGIDVRTFFNPYILGELDAMGAKRGEYAHHGLHLKTMEDPLIAKKKTGVILLELERFIDKFQDY